MVMFLLACAAVVVAMEPTGPRGADADKDLFSAERAMRWVERIAEAPRPPGSVAHGRARDTIVAALRELGGETRVARGNVARAYASHVRAAHVENIVAEFPGDGPPIVLAAHYDSVPTGPGAGDDASGVAVILETLRALRASQGRMPRLSVWITDAEESGLLGARSLVESKTVRPPGIVINLEARGGGGTVFCFQTGPGNRYLARKLARIGPISTSSLMVSLYRRLPNSTDFTVFREAGFTGVDFAFIGNWPAYHTALDTPDRLDVRTVQQEGDAVLALVRALGEESDASAADVDGPDAGWFDVLGRWVVVYPLHWTWPAVGGVGALYVLALLVARKEKGSVPGFFAGLVSSVGGALVAVAVPYGIRRALPDPASDLPWGEAWGMRGIEIALFAWGLLVSGGLAVLVVRRFRGRAAVLGGAFPWACAMVAVAAMEPGAAWWFAIPLLLAIFAILPPKAAPALVLPCVLAWVLLVVPVLHGLTLALGWPGREVVVGVVAFSAAPLFAAFRGNDAPKWGAGLVLLGALVSGGGYGAWTMLSDSPDRPRVRTDFLWTEGDGKGQRLHRPSGDPARIEVAGGVERAAETYIPWLGGDWISEPSDPPKVPAAVRVEGDTLVLEARGAVAEWLVWSSDAVQGVEWEGTTIPTVDGRLRLRLLGGEAAEQRLTFLGGKVPAVQVVALRADDGGLRPAGETAIPAPMWPPPGGAALRFRVSGSP
ncbi:MAG: M20/M25/M40 family metallo-hydrolase [Armatimonadota bacterium]